MLRAGALDVVEVCVEIPMVATGPSLDVELAGSLVPCRVADLL